MRPSSNLTLLAAACVLSACGMMGTSKPTDTLQALATEEVSVKPDDVEGGGELQAMKAYRQLLDGGSPNATLRSEALRRMADLEMARADKLNAESGEVSAADYRAAITRYQEQLAAHPYDPNRDQVLYQLARAQEQAGELESALKTLTDLMTQHPGTGLVDEVQFRRGELAFSLGQYPLAEQAYNALLSTDRANPYRDRALYMQGWARFKQGSFDGALQSFFKVLDAKLADGAGSNKLTSPERFNRADRELLADTFRGVSLALSNLKGAESIPAYTPASKPLRQAYALFVYEQLGEFYSKQEKSKEAADTYVYFVQHNPLNGQAPRIMGLAIDQYERAAQNELAIGAKRLFVSLFGRESVLRNSNTYTWRQSQPRVQICLSDLAKYYHAKAHGTKSAQDYQEAVHWYRELLNAIPNDAKSIRVNFLLAEVLYDSGMYSEAAVEYEHVAYDFPWHEQAPEAGYAALLSHAQLRKGADPLTLSRLQRNAINSALRFAKAFPGNEKTPQVLTDAAEQLFTLKDNELSSRVAMKIIDLKPQASDAQRKIAWNILARSAFDRGAFQTAEQAFGKLMELTGQDDPVYKELAESKVVSLYKLGEQERSVGHLKEAAAHFKTVSEVASQPGVRANAQFDAASAYLDAKDWANAQVMLEDFRQRYPKHALQNDVAPKLAVVYSEQSKWSLAANEMDRIVASGTKDANLARDMIWQIAGYREKAGERPAAIRAYERHLAQSLAIRPVPFEQTIEARDRLARLAHEEGNTKRELALLKEIFDADKAGGAARTDRTRYLAAKSAMALAEAASQAYAAVALVEPLQKQLKIKKGKLEEALSAYALASEPGVADVTTAATYQTANLYRDFGKAILASERPKKLSDIELEQYNVLLEEQASPFEEKASEMHEINIRRVSSGIYDQWVQKSYAALGEMFPVRYGKRERGDGVVLNADPAKLPEMASSLEQSLKVVPKQPLKWNQLGVIYRQMGQFDKAKIAFERSVAMDTKYAPAALNLGILSDLYLGDPGRAVTMYERYLSLVPQDPTVSKWVAEIKRRVPTAGAVAPAKEAS